MKRRFVLKNIDARLALILAAYLLIVLSYSVVNPLFEAPDEHWHYFTTQYVADNWRLPQVDEPYDPWLGQEAAQPPLYYLLGAILISPIDTAGSREAVWLNPFAWIGDASAVANVNRVVHSPSESWPWQGYVLAAHLLRGMSALFGLGTLLCIYGCGRLLWPSNKRFALIATALVAFLPQFDFIHGAISNDSLITFLCSAAIWQLLRMWLTVVNSSRLLALALTIGFAALAKNAGILLFLYAGLVFGLLAIRDRDRTLVRKVLLLVFVPGLMMVGWMWWRNWMLYGDFTATNQFVRIAGGNRDYSWLQALGESRGLWLSLIAVFGWFNVRAPEWVYLTWYVTIALAFAGGLRRVYLLLQTATDGALPSSSSDLRSFLGWKWFPLILLSIWFLMVFVALIYFMMQTQAAQGRLLFPAIIPVSLFVAWGLSQFRSATVFPAASLAALLTTSACVFLVIKPTYSKPRQVSDLPKGILMIDQEMGQGLELMAATVETEVAMPGEWVWFTLYWQAETILARPPEFVMELFGRELARVGNLHSYHGRGLYPANLWPKNSIVADRFAIRLEDDTEVPVLAWAQARIVGEESTARIGSVKVIPSNWPPPSDSILAELGEEIRLADVSLSHSILSPGDMLSLAVKWQVLAAPRSSFTTLVHLGEAELPPLATGDSLPLHGNYPTIVWSEGEVIEDAYRLEIPASLPPGRYPVWVGMYDSEAPDVRLPLVQDGKRQPGDIYLAGWVEIES